MLSKPVVVGAFAGLAVALLTGVAVAAIPDSSGKIHACYQNVSAAEKPVKLLDTAKAPECPSGWKPATWSVKGPQGVQGKQGVQGVPGTNGVSGFTVATATASIVLDAQNAWADAQCPTGTVPLGGGFIRDNGSAPLIGPFNVEQDGPILTYGPDGVTVTGGKWRVWLHAQNAFGTDDTLTVYAECAAMS